MIYLDTCILIYALEDRGEVGVAVRTALGATTETIAVSPLVLHECLVVPLRDKNAELRDRYVAMMERLHQVELDAATFVRAAELRADHGLKTPDALHLAAAQLAGCNALWTMDKRLAVASRGLAVDVLAED